MPLAIRDTSAVPPEDWAFEVVDPSGHLAPFTVTTKNYSFLYARVREYCAANNLPLPSEQDVIDWQCANLHIPCYDSETHTPLINKMGLPFVPRSGGSCCTKIPTPSQ